MKKIIFFIITIFSMTILAQTVEVVVEPKEPVKDETFFVTFKVKTSGSEEPYISFTPFGASVLGKNYQGLSISTIVINGKFTTTKEQAVVYELLAERTGQVYLRNVKVELDGKTIPLDEVRINVLSEAKRIPEAFIEAEASKTKVYLGEGLDVNYYLYVKNSITANDVKEFPKLNKFIKRFHRLNTPVEMVQYKGQVFKRFLTYSARLYAEKIGTAVLDPMTLSVQLVETDYSGFGFGSQRVRNKDLSSPRIEIEVLPLPAEGVPPSFTGLIGDHDFTLSVAKTKYLVNEPIEIKLEVKGKGAVENFDSPVIYSDNNLEQFDTKSEVTELGMQAAKKVFEYTLLARAPLKIESREMSFAYFEPSTGKYIVKNVNVPGIEVSGVAATATGGDVNDKKDLTLGAPENSSFLDSIFKNKKSLEKNQLGLVGPSLLGQRRWFGSGFIVLNSILVLIWVSICIHWGLTDKYELGPKSLSKIIKRDIASMKKSGLNYSKLYHALVALDKKNAMGSGGISIINIVNDSQLSLEAKNYFLNALNFTEGGTYAENRTSKGAIVFEKKHFNELLKNL